MRSDDSRGTSPNGVQDSLNSLQYESLVLFELLLNLNENSLFWMSYITASLEALYFQFI